MIKDYVCEHGVRHGEKDAGEPIVWAGPIGTCECCGRVFFYADSGGWSGKGRITSRIWQPRNRCGRCGGGYRES